MSALALLLRRARLRMELIWLWCEETSVQAHALDFPGTCDKELESVQERRREVRAELESLALGGRS